MFVWTIEGILVLISIAILFICFISEVIVGTV